MRARLCRQFALILFGAAPCLGAGEGRVVAVTRPGAVAGFLPNTDAIAPMMEAGLARLGHRRTAAETLASLVSPSDTVAIHISTRGKPPLATHRAVIDALIAALRRAGVPAHQIIIWSRNEADMVAAGYPPQPDPSGVRTLSVLPGTGFDRGAFYFHENIGELIWGDLDFVGSRPDIDDIVRRAERDELPPSDAPKVPRQTSNKSYFARIVTQVATKIINVPVMSNSESTGLHGCIASLALDSVDNNRRFELEPLWGDPVLAEILAEEPLREKTVLHIMDGLLAQFAGGPTRTINYCHEHGALYFSTDPVAIDATVAAVIEKLRAARQLPESAPILGHIRTAQRLGLGIGHPDRVRIETIALPPAP